MSHLHHVYGRLLRSEILLPELRLAVDQGERAYWEFRLTPGMAPMSQPQVMGSEQIYDDVAATLHRHSHGHRITVPDTGVFQLDPGCRRIFWQPNPEPWWDFGRSHLLGRVLATALHLEGVTALHGSAVVMEEGVVAFLAPGFTGKSTLARELVRRGAGLVTDDTLPVEVCGDGGVKAWPGVQSLRVHGAGGGRDGKRSVPPPEGTLCLEAPTPLVALYLLESVPSLPDGGREAFSRLELGPVQGTMGLLGRTKIGEMLGPGEAPVLLRRLGTIAERVPVTSLAVVRDRERLPEVVERLVEWHGLPVTSTPASPMGAW